MVTKEQGKRSRGRPPLTEQQITDIRLRISSCALKLFQDEGYEAISMRRLAKEANLTPMTLYKYFDSKIEILHLLWEEVFTVLFDDLDDVAAKDPEPRSRLNSVALRYVTYWMDNPNHYFMVFMSKGISQEDVRGFVEIDTILARFDVLRDGISTALDGNVDPATKTLKATLLLCVLNGIAHNLITISSYPWPHPEELVRTAIDGLLSS